MIWKLERQLSALFCPSIERPEPSLTWEPFCDIFLWILKVGRGLLPNLLTLFDFLKMKIFIVLRKIAILRTFHIIHPHVLHIT